ncbi:MAG: hypothetical protein PHY08_12145 [Candidatus Cloacimonetes bacterium]|jgi:competence protein ComGC|nr:hypothetical protein [Candidatus Cloacimonadota bacterium]MDD4157314.1 hypothetical protein [Candidatus Cloacimonadota bacterium]
MRLNEKGFSIYKILALIFMLALIFILALPQFFDLNQKERTEMCISNMKDVKAAAEQYQRERNEVFTGTVDDLIRTKYLRIAESECPEGSVGDKYHISVDEETLEVTITCPNHSEFPDHVLP